MYYPVMNVTQCEGQLSTYHLNGGSMTTSQSEGKKKKKKIEIHLARYNFKINPRYTLIGSNFKINPRYTLLGII